MRVRGRPIANRVLVVTAVSQEAAALGAFEDSQALVVAGGIGRTNAAAETTRAILEQGPFAAVLSAGIAGCLPGAGLELGDLVVASECVYAEEGLLTPEGFKDMRGLGFPLGDFEGNVVPVGAALLAALRSSFRVGPIATVATCSGTDAAAAEIVRRTGALAEAMEGAAVVHAARRLGIPAIELRSISNSTGDRASQRWEIQRAFAALGSGVRRAVESIRAAGAAESARCGDSLS